MIKFQNLALAILSTLFLLAGTSFGQGNGQSCNQGNGTANRGGPQQAIAGLAMMQGRGDSGAGQGMGPQETAQRMIANFDVDGDGELNVEELTNGLSALQQSMLQISSRQGLGSRQLQQNGRMQGQMQNQRMQQRGENPNSESARAISRQSRGGNGQGGASRGRRSGR